MCHLYSNQDCYMSYIYTLTETVICHINSNRDCYMSYTVNQFNLAAIKVSVLKALNIRH